MKITRIRIEIVSNGGILAPSALPTLCKRVEEVIENNHAWDGVVVLDGRLPVWAYAALTHALHPAQGVGTYEPRSASYIIVARHSEVVPEVGTLLPEGADEKILEVEI